MFRRLQRFVRLAGRQKFSHLVTSALVCLLVGWPFPSVLEEDTETADSGQNAHRFSTVSSAQAATFQSAASSRKKQRASYRLARLYDGDSFDLVDASGRRLSVRLYGIDAPEKEQPFGDVSRRHLYGLMKGCRFQLQLLYRDQYDRHVALVYRMENGVIDKVSLNERQVRAGMDWVYDRFCSGSFCSTWKREESLARQKRLGLWKDAFPIPPYLWRRSSKSW